MVGKASRANRSNTAIDVRYPTPPDGVELIIFNPIYEGLATLHEMQTIYTLKDCLLFDEAISYKQRIAEVADKIHKETL